MNKQWIFTKIFNLKQEALVLIRDTKAFNYSYATLKQMQELLWPKLVENKLIIIHKVLNNEVVTQIIDIEDWSFIESSIDIWEVNCTRIEKFTDNKWKNIEVIDNNTKDPQWVWSIISYYRRYNLLSLLDLEQEDDDANNWSNRAKAKTYIVKNKLPKFDKDAFEKFKKVENYKDYITAKEIIEKKYDLTLDLAKQVKTYYETKDTGVELDNGQPPF